MTNKTFRIVIYSVLIIMFVACGTHIKTVENSNLYEENNSENNKNTRAFSGKLNNYEYDKFIDSIEKALETTIPLNKSILINFNQKSSNCFSFKVSKYDNMTIINNRIRNSSRISTNNHAIDFFVYTKDSYNKNIYEKKNEFILDSGFFYQNIFLNRDICSAFLIVKPNGEFYKYYGEDYYSLVKEILVNDKN